MFELTVEYLPIGKPSSYNAEHYYPNQTQNCPGVVIATHVNILTVYVHRATVGSAY